MSRVSWTDAALGMAKTIAEKSPVAVVSTKHLMNRECRAMGTTLMARCPRSLVSGQMTILSIPLTLRIQEGLQYTAAWNMSMLQAEVGVY
jgi:hypothetical protein